MAAVRDTNAATRRAEPWKAEPGPAVEAVLGDALEVLRIVAVLASPALTRASQEIWRRIGLPGPGDRTAAPRGGPAGRLSRWSPGRAGEPRFSPGSRTSCPCGQTATATSATTGSSPRCHRRRPQPRAWPGSSPSVPTPPPPAAAVSIARAHPGVWATVGLHPHEASDGVDGERLCCADPTRRSWPSANVDWTSTTSTRRGPPSARRSRPRSAWPPELGLALVVHTRDAWDDTFEILSAEGIPDRWVLHCFSGGPTEAKRGLDLGRSFPSPG